MNAALILLLIMAPGARIGAGGWSTASVGTPGSTTAITGPGTAPAVTGPGSVASVTLATDAISSPSITTEATVR